MKKQTLLLALIFITSATYAQEITGSWYGAATIQGTTLRIVFNIKKNDSGYISTLDSPDQHARGIPTSSTTFQAPLLKITATMLKLELNASLQNDTLKGTLKQNGYSFPLNLTRNAIEKKAALRPQEPVKPYPYYSEEVSFENPSAHIRLSGTLTFPQQQGNYPAVILISGSGAQNRDEEIMGHKPFLVLSDYLTRNGIAVLRYDDRGTAKSTGNFSTATSADFATDTEAALNYLLTRKEINSKSIGLIGHSEGGIIAPMVAARTKNIHFIVLLAAPGIPGDQISTLQTRAIGKAAGISEEELERAEQLNNKLFAIVKKPADQQTFLTDLRSCLEEAVKLRPDTNQTTAEREQWVKIQMAHLTTPWVNYYLSHDPAPELKKVKCPVLSLNGDKDFQVPAAVNQSAIKNALQQSGNKDVTITLLPDHNHLFQQCVTGRLDEYEKIEQTFSPIALMQITSWIRDHASGK